jgi:serine/threonine protein kinase
LVRHERDVAIKVLHPDLGAALGADRFLAEIKTTARLQHPHILPLLDSGAADGLLYYVMPFVRGETLRARLERERQLPIPDALRIAREVAGALDHMSAAPLASGVPKLILNVAGYLRARNRAEYDAAPDGSRFLMIKEPPKPETPPVVLVQNWFAELKRKMGS